MVLINVNNVTAILFYFIIIIIIIIIIVIIIVCILICVINFVSREGEFDPRIYVDNTITTSSFETTQLLIYSLFPVYDGYLSKKLVGLVCFIIQ